MTQNCYTLSTPAWYDRTKPCRIEGNLAQTQTRESDRKAKWHLTVKVDGSECLNITLEVDTDSVPRDQASDRLRKAVASKLGTHDVTYSTLHWRKA